MRQLWRLTSLVVQSENTEATGTSCGGAHLSSLRANVRQLFIKAKLSHADWQRYATARRVYSFEIRKAKASGSSVSP